MKRKNLLALSQDELVEGFIRAALNQSEALRLEEDAEFNRLFDQMEEIEKELKSRAGDQRRGLIPFYSHPNAQVRYAVAVATLEINREAARNVLEMISERHEFPQAAHANGILEAIKAGRT